MVINIENTVSYVIERIPKLTLCSMLNEEC